MSTPEPRRVVAVILDIVGSRRLPERESAQQAIEETLARATETVPALVPPHPTVGDEFQAVHATVGEAVRFFALVRLLLPEGLDLRAGLGGGTTRDVRGSAMVSPGQPLRDGSAWWNARAAIDQAHHRQYSGSSWVRSWYLGEGREAGHAGAVNATLLLADHVIGRMKDRERRITAAALQGLPQQQIARTERLSQSAVSQTLHRGGGIALRDALEVLTAGESPDQEIADSRNAPSGRWPEVRA